MSTTGDEVGGWLILAAVVVGGMWLFGAFDEDEPLPDVPINLAPPRPTGLLKVTTIDSGAVWLLDADSVKGPRSARQGWVVKDLSKDKTTSYRDGRELYLVNCDTDAYQNLSSVLYTPDGVADTLYNETPSEAEVRYAAPGSNAAAVTWALCMRHFDSPR